MSESYEDVRKIKVQLIQWIPKFSEYPTQVVMPDASITEGFAEADCKKLKPDAIIQFERFGFVRINEADEKLVASGVDAKRVFNEAKKKYPKEELLLDKVYGKKVLVV